MSTCTREIFSEIINIYLENKILQIIISILRKNHLILGHCKQVHNKLCKQYQMNFTYENKINMLCKNITINEDQSCV